MKRIILGAAAAAATFAAGSAMAQPYGHHRSERHDGHDWRGRDRDYHADRWERHGDHHHYRRDDWRDDGWRRHHRHRYEHRDWRQGWTWWIY
jgi:hypothetical protein